MADETAVADASGKAPPAEEREEGELEEGEIGSDDLPPRAVAQHQPHPLEHSWTFWFDNPAAKAKQATWGSSLRPIHTFSTVEDFWGLYNNIHHPSKLVTGADFHCFKHKIEPKWEDPVCANGGKWTITCSRGKVDTWWLYTLLAMIGEQFDYGDEICGVVVNVRAKQVKIALWTKNASNQDAQVKGLLFNKYSWLTTQNSVARQGHTSATGTANIAPTNQEDTVTDQFNISIGRQWKEFLDYNDPIGFIFHEEAKKLDRAAKDRYQV